jgi:hypothetical protein
MLVSLLSRNCSQNHDTLFDELLVEALRYCEAETCWLDSRGDKTDDADRVHDSINTCV